MTNWAKQVGVSIGKMHDADVVHGDLTTSNIMVREIDEKVVLIDFGLSMVRSAALNYDRYSLRTDVSNLSHDHHHSGQHGPGGQGGGSVRLGKDIHIDSPWFGTTGNH